MSFSPTIRTARLNDAQAIADLINNFAEQQLMIQRNAEEIIERIRDFIVAVDKDRIIGVCAIAFFTNTLAEIRSLAVHDHYQKMGIGKRLVESAEVILSEEAVKEVFVLTLNEAFFDKLGYKKVEKTRFPQKIWRDCLNCPKVMQCDEIAMLKVLG